MRLTHGLECSMGVVVAWLLLVVMGPAAGAGQAGARNGEWRSYGGDLGSTKYSALDQITAANVDRLEVAWSWRSPDVEILAANPRVRDIGFEATPLMVGGVLYVSTALSQVAALDAQTGRTLWVHDPESWQSGRPPNNGFVHRGVAYWSDGGDERIFIGTGDAHLLALEARTGKPVPSFGDGGRIDLTEGLGRPVQRRTYGVTSPPLVVRDVVIVGAAIKDDPSRKTMPPGTVRAFDVRTGALRWAFHTIPQEGEYGNETWEEGSWRYTGNTNVWAPMSADPELGYVYLPVSTPTNDWYGGHRPGDNLFAESLVAVDASTGQRVWHFQIIHHGIWDYDLAAAPNLVDIEVGGRPIRAVAQVTKHGFTFVFDRRTGAPIWPIEERPVGRSMVPGEETAATQPFPTKPPPFERQGISPDDLIDFTPELRRAALDVLQRFDYGPLFTPPSERGTLYLPGGAGGANWSGAAFDPETGLLYVPSSALPLVGSLQRPDPARSDLRYVHAAMGSSGEMVDLASATSGFFPTVDGLPLIKPPYGQITAIDLGRGEIVWQVANGEGPRHHPALRELDLPRLGGVRAHGLVVTKTLLLAPHGGSRAPGGGDESDNLLRAYDKASGALLAEHRLAGPAGGAAMTYLAGGRQFVIVPLTGPGAGLVGFVLPSGAVEEPAAAGHGNR